MKKVLLFYCLSLPASFGSAAVETFNPVVFIPGVPNLIQSQPSYTTVTTIDASGEKYGIVFQAPKTGNISRIAARTNAAAGTWSLRASLQTVSAAGLPTETYVCADSSATISGTTAAEWATSSAFPSACAVVGGSTYTAVIEATAATTTVLWAGLQDWTSMFPYTASSSSASGYVKNTAAPSFGLEYDDGTYPFIPNSLPIETVTTITLSTSSTPNVIGNRFSLPQDTVIWGAWLWADVDANGDIVLFDDDDAVIIATVSISSGTRSATSPSIGFYMFPSSVTLTGDTFYRIAMRNHTSTVSSIYRLDYDSSAILSQLTEYGANMYFTYARDPNETSDWTDLTSSRASIGIIVSGFETGGTAAGGMKASPFVQ